jgi:pyruvate/2-oxoglutarate dehydrogenase complex dihydrolipoamide dehydrogenase (E3) component
MQIVVIEKYFVSRTCLDCGCRLTKFLWQALKLKQKVQKSYEYGFKVNFSRVTNNAITQAVFFNTSKRSSLRCQPF